MKGYDKNYQLCLLCEVENARPEKEEHEWSGSNAEARGSLTLQASRPRLRHS